MLLLILAFCLGYWLGHKRCKAKTRALLLDDLVYCNRTQVREKLNALDT